jgi:tetratricopeptide (TPR) repeat protein
VITSTPIPETLFDEIESYLRGEMDTGAAAAFNQRMAADPMLREQVTTVELMIAGIEEASFRNMTDSFRNDYTNVQQHPEIAQAGTVFTMRRLSVAAIVLVMAGAIAWYYLRPGSTGNLYAKYYQPDEGWVTNMGTEADYAFSRAMVDYKTGHYTEAAKAWQKTIDAGSQSDTLLYFTGAAYMANNDIEKALPMLMKITCQPASIFYKDACWYAGLAYMKKADFANAIKWISLSEHKDKTILLQQLRKK